MGFLLRSGGPRPSTKARELLRVALKRRPVRSFSDGLFDGRRSLGDSREPVPATGALELMGQTLQGVHVRGLAGAENGRGTLGKVAHELMEDLPHVFVVLERAHEVAARALPRGVASNECHELGTVDRLREVVVASGLLAALSVSGHGVRRERNDWAVVLHE